MKRIYFSFASIVLFFAASLALTSCGDAEGQQSESAVKNDNSKSARIQIAKANSESYTNYIRVVGTLKPLEKASLSYQLGGNIKKVVKDKGSYVKKDDVLVIIDNDVIKANLDAAKAQYDLAQINFEKQEKIFKDKVNSEFQYLQAKYTRDQAKAGYELAKAQYDDTFIKAPFSGVVDSKYFEEGELALPGMPIVDLINTASIKITAGVPETNVGKVKVGDKVDVIVKSVSDEKISGRVIFVGASVTQNNRTFPVEVLIPNSGNKLKPELVAELYINGKTYENIISIPDEIALRGEDGYSVFIEKNGIVENRPIKILDRFADKIVVGDGLKAGENLVVVGYQNLVHGQKVIVVN